MSIERRGKERLLMSVDGEWREIDMNHLPAKVVNTLELAYEQSKVVGFGKVAFIDTSNILADRIADYSKVCARLDGNKEMTSSRVYATEMGFTLADSPLMLEGLLWVDAQILADPEFNTRAINTRNVRQGIAEQQGRSCSYANMANEFNKWKENHFFEGLHVGFIKFLKFYYMVAKSLSGEKLSVVTA